MLRRSCRTHPGACALHLQLHMTRCRINQLLLPCCAGFAGLGAKFGRKKAAAGDNTTGADEVELTPASDAGTPGPTTRRRAAAAVAGAAQE